ncbi:MAG: T9SS type A sorting domain-containing protein [Candidatus Kapaibacterium sp.]
MIKYILLLLLANSSVFSVDFNKYDFTPLLVKEGFILEQIETNSTGNIIVSGYNKIGDDPQTHIFNNVVLKSIDKGLNWTIIYLDSNETLPKSERSFYNVEELKYLDNGNILLFSHTGYILQSFDDGETWIRDSLGVFKTPVQVEFIDSENGIALFFKSYDKKLTTELYLTNDGGMNWNELNVPVNALLEYETELRIGEFYSFGEGTISFFMVDRHYENDSLIESTNYLISSPNYGTTWEKEIFNLPVERSRIKFLDDKYIILFGILQSKTHFDNLGNPFGHDIVLESFDRGTSWDTLLINLDTNVNSSIQGSLEYVDEKYLLFRGANSGISIFDRGNKGIIALYPNNILELREQYNYQNSYDYIRFGDKILVTGGGGYLFYVDYKSPITSVEDLFSQSELEIYPNPVSRSQSINLKLAPVAWGISTISIIDMNGRTISSFDRNLTSISETLEINPNNSLTSGLYFVQIEYPNGFVDRQKFIVN